MTVHKHNPEIRRVNHEMRVKYCWERTMIDSVIAKASRIRNVTGDNSCYRELLERLMLQTEKEI
jgi:hypothetical protein